MIWETWIVCTAEHKWSKAPQTAGSSVNYFSLPWHLHNSYDGKNKSDKAQGQLRTNAIRCYGLVGKERGGICSNEKI